MLDAVNCRDFAKLYREDAKAVGCSDKKATVLRNIARTFAGLASQYELLRSIQADEATKGGGH